MKEPASIVGTFRCVSSRLWRLAMVSRLEENGERDIAQILKAMTYVTGVLLDVFFTNQKIVHVNFRTMIPRPSAFTYDHSLQNGIERVR